MPSRFHFSPRSNNAQRHLRQQAVTSSVAGRRVIPQKPLIASTLLLASSLLAGCQSTAEQALPLDPVIGNTGGALSEIAKRADVQTYDLTLEVFPQTQSIAGVGTAEFLLLQATKQVELKLDSRFSISQITVDGQVATYQREAGVLTIELPSERPAGATVKVAVSYAGKPHVALNAPWAGGTVWSKTPDGQPWIATAVQGEGCDLFWPCKDHFSDKANQMRIKLTVPKPLSAVTNGVLQQITPVDGEKQQFDWLLSVPASDYNIALNIGPYSRIQQSYQSSNGATVPIEFWALPENVDKAKALLKDDVMDQVAFYQRRLGPFPWGTQKLGFVETPHLGMEHQTVNAYGKGYKRDEYGFDWLLHHELAHEWFGNLMTHQQLNDAWLHEGFGLYMQPLYALEKLGPAAYQYQMYKSYLGLLNCEPIVRKGQITSDDAFNPDIYGKGGWTLHTLRGLIGDDLFWQATKELVYGTADTNQLTYPIAPRYRNSAEFEAIVNRLTGKDFRWFFAVYLEQAALPELKQQRTDSQVTLTWQVPAGGAFPMPLEVAINGKVQQLDFSKGPVVLPLQPSDRLVIDPQMKVLQQLPLIGSCQENSEKVKNKRKG